MGEGGTGIKGGERGEGPTLIGEEEASISGNWGKAGSDNPLQDFRDSLEEDDDAEGGRGIIELLGRLVEDNTIGLFERGGVVTEPQEGPRRETSIPGEEQ